MTTPLKIATRGSELALWQAMHVSAALPVPSEITVVETEGDRVQDRPLAEIGGQGVFAKEIQHHVLHHQATLAVHSAKDLPSVTVSGLQIGAWLPRADPRDMLVGSTLGDLPNGARVGTSSIRRAAQLLALRPDVEIVPLRGNIRTRLEKGQRLDAIFVAAAALQRLDIWPEITEILSPELMLPQVGQGAIAIECRVDDDATLEMLASVNDSATEKAVIAERSLLRVFGTGCSLPIGGLAELSGHGLMLRAMVAAHDGTRILRGSASGDEPTQLGSALARSLVERGALALLADSDGE
ncbi:hydroxymethylbilane synthase [Ferrimicrobium sp.]|uniref:hydroxymethylbilane synthase n=1 Tax=Ferrimicrobium sp. TaxID=2926050 RepID=UPI00261D6125|nr:hydroxymethylbilane synthase [Ferrimicrobium sp.]